MRRERRAWGLVRAAAVLLVALPVAAQESPDPVPDGAGRVAPRAGSGVREGDPGLTFYASFGWQNTMVSDRLCPVRVELSPMEIAFSGTVTVEHRQDSSQSAVITAPFAATPDRATRVEFLTALPWDAPTVRITVRDERGRVLRSQLYDGVTLPLPNRIGSDAGLIVSAGASGAAEGLNRWAALISDVSTRIGFQRRATPSAQASASDIDDALRQGTRARALETDLPTTWAGYDGVGVLVVEAGAARAADPRALEAVRAWVARGGHVAILATGPGDAWRQWLPGEFMPPVSLGEPITVRPPADMGAVIGAFRARIAVLRQQGPGVADPVEEGGGAPAAEVPGAAERITARPIALGENAGALGWTSRWACDEGPLLAEGPAGLGWATIVTADPAHAGAVASTIISGCLWRDALSTPLSHVYHRSGVMPLYGYSSGYGATPSSDAVNIALEQVADVPLVGGGVFITIVICVLGLAAMVGPGDYFGLRRLRLSQWSWLTALLWTGLASAGAYYLPRIVRSEPTTLHRLSLVDAVCRPSSTPGVCTPVLTAGVGFSGLYSAQSGSLGLSGVDPGSWWRGVSAADMIGEGRGGGGVVPILQAAAGGELGSERSAPLRRLPVAIWTFRTFMDAGAPTLDLAASAERTPEGVRVTLGNFPDGARVVRAAVLVDEGWLRLPDETVRERQLGRQPRRAENDSPEREPAAAVGEHGAGVWGAAFPLSSATPEAPTAWSPGRWNQGSRAFLGARTATDSPGPLLDVPGPAERTGALHAMAATGRWAVLHLKVRSWPPDYGLSWPASSAHTRVLRLAIPLEER